MIGKLEDNQPYQIFPIGHHRTIVTYIYTGWVASRTSSSMSINVFLGFKDANINGVRALFNQEKWQGTLNHTRHVKGNDTGALKNPYLPRVFH